MIRRRHNKILLIIFGVFIAMIIITGLVGLKYYNRFFSPNLTIAGAGKYTLYIPTGSTYESVLDSLRSANYIDDMASFEWVADFMKYPESVKSGRYIFTNGMSNRAMINKLRSGAQSPLNIVITKKRLKTELAESICSRLEISAGSLLQLLNDQDFLEQYGLNIETVMAIFLQNTYEVWWNTSAGELVDRMYSEYERFWNKERLSKAADLGLSPIEVITIASIVEEETIMEDEKPTVAGVYINRIRENWKLQADPTIKFALKNFGLQRILYKHLEVESPYNTYKYKGLPPGPICLPGPGSIAAVLNAEKHAYMFMCAKDDLSGYHNFAKTDRQHNQNRRKYQQALNQRNIY